MGPEDTFFYGVQTYVYTNDITKVGLGKIEVVSNKGEAELTVTGLVTRLKFYFIKEGKEWKLDWSNGIAIWSQARVKTLELAGIDENIYILEWVEPNKGKGLNKDLWQPLMN
jgi:hypothetical protein